MALFVMVSEFAIDLIASMGYAGVVILMAMESMLFPVPSEAVMPFVGFLVANGTFKFWPALALSVLGTLIGSVLSYWMGVYGYGFLKKYGKYLLIDEHELEWSKNWFYRHGHISILTGRLIPVLRHLISIVAGFAKMNVSEFLIFTAIGGAIWNFILLFVGIKLENNWELVKHYSEPIDIAIIALLAIIAIVYLSHRVRKHMQKGKAK